MSNKTRFLFGKEKIEALPAPEVGKRATYHDTKTKGGGDPQKDRHQECGTG